jgi:hypothetical protein
MTTPTKFPGQILTMLYPSRSGQTASSMPLDEENIAKLQDALQKAGPGSKIRWKPTSEKYRAEKLAKMQAEGKQGGPAEYILEILNANELAEERARVQSTNTGSL